MGRGKIEDWAVWGGTNTRRLKQKFNGLFGFLFGHLFMESKVELFVSK